MRINQTRSEGVDGDKLERLLADIRGHIYSAGDWKILAEKANLSYSTIASLAYGDTKSPHLRTVFKVMTALGKEDPVLDAFKAEKPVSAHVASKRKSARKTTRQILREKRDEKLFPHRKRNIKRSQASAAMH